MRLKPLSLWVAFLFFSSAAAAVALLLISGWFIAATALAGVTATVIGFNYVLPSAAIRMLALVRILAGYGANYFGHEQLLNRLNSLRSKVYDRVMQQALLAPRAAAMETLEQHTSALANRQLAADIPVLTGLLIAIGVGITLARLWPAQLWLYLCCLGLVVAVYGWQTRCARAAVRDFRHCSGRYRVELETYLRAASLWSLSDYFARFEHVQQQWAAAWQRQKALEYRAESALQLVAWGGLLLCLALLGERLWGQPLLILLPLVMLSLPEWLGPALRSRPARAEADAAHAALATFDVPGAADLMEPATAMVAPIRAMQLLDFSWSRERFCGAPLTAQFKAGELIGIQGDSGAGKTSLLMALTGLLPARGQLQINGGELIAGRCAAIHYCEQHPSILADTLRNNLLIARPDATEQHLQEALVFACLPYLQNELDQWLGDQGRLLSGGERKRLGLARAWLTQSDVWLLDEPFEGLDNTSRQQLASHLRRESTQRIVLLVSHRPVDGLRYDQIVTLTGAVAGGTLENVKR